MTHLHKVLAGLILLSGCNAKPKVDNPLVGPPPPRNINVADAGTADEMDNSSEPAIRQAGAAEQLLPSGGDLSDAQVVATVNGAPIFASEILNRYSKNLARAREELSPEKYREVREALIKRDLGKRVERKVLVEALKSTIDPSQVAALDAHLDKLFEEEIERMKKEAKVTSHIELDQMLQTQGASLLSLRDEFGHQRMAMEYLGSKAQKSAKSDFSREELVAYYRSHLEDYATPTRVRWQRIVISHRQHGGRDKAEAVLKQAVNELRSGVAFGEVAKRYSNGPKTQDAGQWDWTQAGSLANKDIEKALFELPVGTISQVFEDGDQFQLVYVNEREEAGYTPFETVQDKISKMLQEEAYQQATRDVMMELSKTADIWTIFDKRQEAESPIRLQ